MILDENIKVEDLSRSLVREYLIKYQLNKTMAAFEEEHALERI